jgi:hypothetical protein
VHPVDDVEHVLAHVDTPSREHRLGVTRRRRDDPDDAATPHADEAAGRLRQAARSRSDHGPPVLEPLALGHRVRHDELRRAHRLADERDAPSARRRADHRPQPALDRLGAAAAHLVLEGPPASVPVGVPGDPNHRKGLTAGAEAAANSGGELSEPLLHRRRQSVDGHGVRRIPAERRAQGRRAVGHELIVGSRRRASVAALAKSCVVRGGSST